MNPYLAILAAVTLIAVLALVISIRREGMRSRVLGAFIAGLIAYELDRGASYEELLSYIGHEFDNDFWADPKEKFLKRHRNLFYSEPMGNGGFNMFFWDFFDRAKATYDIARLPDSELRVAAFEKLSVFLKGSAAQKLMMLRKDRDRERLWEKTGDDELYNDLRFYDEMKSNVIFCSGCGNKNVAGAAECTSCHAKI